MIDLSTITIQSWNIIKTLYLTETVHDLPDFCLTSKQLTEFEDDVQWCLDKKIIVYTRKQTPNGQRYISLAFMGYWIFHLGCKNNFIDTSYITQHGMLKYLKYEDQKP